MRYMLATTHEKNFGNMLSITKAAHKGVLVILLIFNQSSSAMFFSTSETNQQHQTLGYLTLHKLQTSKAF